MKPTLNHFILAASFAVATFFVVMPVKSQPDGNTNAVSAPVLTNSPSTNDVGMIGQIKFNDELISKAIESLARMADINYMVDPRLLKWWAFPDASGNDTHEPIVSLCWTNLTAREGLLWLLQEYNLVLVEDPATTVARITYTNQFVIPVDFSLLPGDTNVCPLVHFTDVPITTGLAGLARNAGINFVLDPKFGYGLPDKYGRLVKEPLLSMRWQKLTAEQAFVAICENYDFVIVKGSMGGIVRIKPKD